MAPFERSRSNSTVTFFPFLYLLKTSSRKKLILHSQKLSQGSLQVTNNNKRQSSNRLTVQQFPIVLFAERERILKRSERSRLLLFILGKVKRHVFACCWQQVDKVFLENLKMLFDGNI